jgi:hypothetical protein
LRRQEAIGGKAKTAESRLDKEFLQSGLLSPDVAGANGPLLRRFRLQLLCGLALPIPGLVRRRCRRRWSGLFDELGQDGGLGSNVRLRIRRSLRAGLVQHHLASLGSMGVQEILQTLRLISEIEEGQAHAIGVRIQDARRKRQRGGSIRQGNS